VNLHMRLVELAKITTAPAPVVSVYLDSRWADEHQRDRVRIFLKNELAEARRPHTIRAADADLDWVEAQGAALVERATGPEANGVALFACGALGLRDVLHARMPFENAFIVAPAPFLRPLAALLTAAPATLVVFVDGESARLIPLMPAGAGEEVRLESAVPGHPRTGGWAQRAQSDYQRHSQAQHGRHFEAVAESLAGLAASNGIERIVLAGEPRNVALLRHALPVGIAELVERIEGQREAEEVDAVLTGAAKGGKAAAGLEATIEAINRGAVHRLFLLKEFRQPGYVCTGCGVLDAHSTRACRACGKATREVELGEAMTDRVVAAGGTVTTLGIHRPLHDAGGIAARLRYSL
jgi:peptide chain release factor subunit 1